MYLPVPIRTPRWIIRYYSHYLWGVRSSQAVYLTFDDGPTTDVTTEILQLLNTYRAKATFFCVGHNVDQHPQIFKKIINQGHSWGNHTYHHEDFKTNNLVDYYKSMEKCRISMERYSLQTTKLFRPPQGRINKTYTSLLEDAYQVVFWTLLSMDHQHINVDLCVRNLKKVQQGDIVVLHDNTRTKDVTLQSLEIFLKWANDKNIPLLGLPMQ